MNRIPTEGLKPYQGLVPLAGRTSLNEQNPDRGIETTGGGDRERSLYMLE